MCIHMEWFIFFSRNVQKPFNNKQTWGIHVTDLSISSYTCFQKTEKQFIQGKALDSANNFFSD